MLSAEQKTLRLQGLGASEIGAVVGADGAYDTPLSVWARKTGRLPVEDDTETPEHIELGNLLEPVVAALYTRRTGRELYESGTLVHPTDPLRIATPDRLVRGESMVVQIKKARTRASWGREGTDEIPENIIAQCAWELSVTGRDVAEVPVLFWGSHLSIYTIKRDDELIAGLAEIAHKWWRDHVVTGYPPEPDGSERSRETISKMFPKSGGNLIPLGHPEPGSPAAEIFGLAHDYILARDGGKEVDGRKEAAGNALRLLIGNHDGFAAPWGTISWCANGAGTTRWKAVAEELGAPPELIAKHTSEPSRTLRVNLKTQALKALKKGS